MVEHLGPTSSQTPRDEKSYIDKRKPTSSPPKDDFRKFERDRSRPTKNLEKSLEEIEMENGEESPPSIFNLPRSNKGKTPVKGNSSPKEGENSPAAEEKKPVTSPASPLIINEDETPVEVAEKGLIPGEEKDNEIPQNNKLPKQSTKISPKIAQSSPEKGIPLTDSSQIKENSPKVPPQQMEGLRKPLDKENSSKINKTEKKEKSKENESMRREGIQQNRGEGIGIGAPVQASGFQAGKAEEVKELAPPSTIQDIAREIVDRIQILRQGGETTTTLTLRHPPLMDGATISLTTTDSAKEKFNISFANLSPDAKQFLDRKLSGGSLQEALDKKGIVVTGLTTTTQAEKPIMTEQGQNAGGRQQGDQQGQQQGGGRQQQGQGRQRQQQSDYQE